MPSGIGRSFSVNCATGLAIFFGTVLLMPPGHAAPPETPRTTERMVGEVVTQPLADVNLKRKDIPPVLTAIVDNPYGLDGIRRCRDVIAAVRALDEVLGPDFDVAAAETKGDKRRKTVGSIAGGVINGLIPFRFLIREISGANRADEAYRAAIYAGVVRRGFLKGVGKQRRCKAPGAPVARPPQLPYTAP
jgi:hypothetical protein